MEKLNLEKNNLRKFGVTMGIAFMAIALLIFLKHKHSVVPTFIIALVFFITAFLIPAALKPVYVLWMKFAFVLSWVNTRLILFAIFYLLFMPIGLMMKLFGRDLLDTKIDKFKDSYWRKKEKKRPGQIDFERQF